MLGSLPVSWTASLCSPVRGLVRSEKQGLAFATRDASGLYFTCKCLSAVDQRFKGQQKGLGHPPQASPCGGSRKQVSFLVCLCLSSLAALALRLVYVWRDCSLFSEWSIPDAQ